MAIDIAQPVGCVLVDVVLADTGPGERLDVEGVYCDGIQVSGIAGGTELQPMGNIERDSDGEAIGPPITADGIYALANTPWVLDMPLTELWMDRTVEGDGEAVLVTLHYTRRF